MLEECRWVYNKTLETRKNAYEQEGKSLGYYDTATLLPVWKQDRPSLKTVHSQVLQNAQLRVDLAFKAFFRRVKAKEKEPGYPRFRGRGWYDSMTYPQYGNGVRLDGNQLSLSKLGQVNLVLHRELCGTPKTVTIRRQSGKWYACFSCECAVEPLPAIETAVGIDVGLTSFATLSTGKKIDNPRFFRKDEHELAKVQRKLSQETKGTPERARRRKVVGRVHERIANHRRDFAHKLSRRLINEFGLVAFEELNLKNMLQNANLSKSIADAAWNQLVQYTTYKAESAGRRVALVDPRNTSQRCSKCGSIVQKNLAVRVHHCPVCGLIMDRDENAAINILALGLQCVGSQSLEAPGFSRGE
jgi:putative transposase